MMADVQAVVHMGGISVEGPFAPILQANVVGVYNLYEAARKNGTKRVAFASSNHVTGFYKQSETIAAERPPRPDGYYGLSKAFGEDISRMYFDRLASRPLVPGSARRSPSPGTAACWPRG